MTAPIPYPNVTGHLHGGPYDDDQLKLPWPKTEIPMPVWDETNMIDGVTNALYRLRGLWMGQPDAHYDYVDPNASRVSG